MPVELAKYRDLTSHRGRAALAGFGPLVTPIAKAAQPAAVGASRQASDLDETVPVGKP